MIFGAQSAGPSAAPRPPTRWSFIVFNAKRAVLCAQRGLIDLAEGAPRHPCRPAAEGFDVEAGRSVTRLWVHASPAEAVMERGKVQNLAAAAARLDGVVIPAGAVFSFWRQVGPPTIARGFVRGRMIQQGCMTPSVGGGLCQLTNALYDVALQAGCDILERHRHSRQVPGSQAELGRDATVAWNYVDLRFRPRLAVRLEVGLDAETLSVSLRQSEPRAARQERPTPDVEASPPTANSCGDCDALSCHLREGPPRDRPRPSATA